MTIDAHHHFWDPARADYPWMTDALAAIRRPFGPNDLRPLLAATGMDRTILVQTRSSLEETREFLAIAEAERFVEGVVGWVDLADPGVADVIAELRSGPGGDRLVGIRHQVHDEPDPDWLGRPDVRHGLRSVQAAGLTYDLLVRTRELPAAIDAARDLPDLRFVLDHAAKPPLRTGALDAWKVQVRRLAELPNVACKLSGLVTEADWERWTIADLRPATDVVIEAFGADRILFGSDWPVCLLAADYTRVVATARELVADLTPEERGRIFDGSAVAWYRLDRAAESPR